jgi:hypothetical protein
MNARSLLTIVLAISAGGHCAAYAGEGFERVQVLLERNVMDKDAEIKFEAIGGNGGLASLKVVGPDGRTVIDFKTPESKLGIRHLSLESPEPKNDGSVQADFPAGVYIFTGTGVDGQRLEAKATLSHDFPEPTALLRPLPDAKNVPITGLQVSWKARKGIDAHVVVIEDEATGRAIRANLAGSATSFSVPDGFLQPGTEYKVAVGTVAKGGNASFIEIGFTTTKK